MIEKGNRGIRELGNKELVSERKQQYFDTNFTNYTNFKFIIREIRVKKILY